MLTSINRCEWACAAAGDDHDYDAHDQDDDDQDDNDHDHHDHNNHDDKDINMPDENPIAVAPLLADESTMESTG